MHQWLGFYLLGKVVDCDDEKLLLIEHREERTKYVHPSLDELADLLAGARCWRSVDTGRTFRQALFYLLA